MGVVDFHTDAGSQEGSTLQTQGNDQPVEGAHTLVFGTKSCCEIWQLNLALKAKQGLLPTGRLSKKWFFQSRFMLSENRKWSQHSLL